MPWPELGLAGSREWRSFPGALQSGFAWRLLSWCSVLELTFSNYGGRGVFPKDISRRPFSFGAAQRERFQRAAVWLCQVAHGLSLVNPWRPVARCLRMSPWASGHSSAPPHTEVSPGAISRVSAARREKPGWFAPLSFFFVIWNRFVG
jgi:hypothetical protein